MVPGRQIGTSGPFLQWSSQASIQETHWTGKTCVAYGKPQAQGLLRVDLLGISGALFGEANNGYRSSEKGPQR